MDSENTAGQTRFAATPADIMVRDADGGVARPMAAGAIRADGAAIIGAIAVRPHPSGIAGVRTFTLTMTDAEWPLEGETLRVSADEAAFALALAGKFIDALMCARLGAERADSAIAGFQAEYTNLFWANGGEFRAAAVELGGRFIDPDMPFGPPSEDGYRPLMAFPGIASAQRAIDRRKARPSPAVPAVPPRMEAPHA